MTCNEPKKENESDDDGFGDRSDEADEEDNDDKNDEAQDNNFMSV